MATIPHAEPSLDAAVNAAVRQLVSVRVWNDAQYVTLPVYYPSGTAVTIAVRSAPGGFRVSDSGLTYRELEQVGADRFFASNAKRFAGEVAAHVEGRHISATALPEQLAGVMADIASAAGRLAHKVAAKVGARGEAEIADHLIARLEQVFGSDRVERQARIVGPSTKDWDADAIVHLGSRDAVFQAVPNHHASVYSTAAMFHDLALKDAPPVTVAVVHDKTAMGYFFGILSQAGHVIEEGQTNKAYQEAAGWLAA